MAHPSPEKPAVLLVDDRADKSLALQCILEPLGYELLSASSGEEALRLLLSRKFNLVLLDVNMPELDGFQTADLIRQRETLKELPIIFVSADVSEERLQKGYELGAVDFIRMPINATVLRARVSTFIALHRRTEQLEKANSELSEVNQQMQSFLYTVSHDLRAPLRSINSFSKILLEEHYASLDEAGQDLVKRIASSGIRMDKLLSDLLHYSRLTRWEFNLAPIDLATVIKGVCENVREEIKAVHAKVEVQEQWPTVNGNEVLLEQCMCNLLTNALKFVAKGAVPEVKIWAESKGGKIRIFVQDNGIGISPEYHERIYGVFERLHANHAYPGTGIGLAIVRKAVERMNGRTGVESSLGGGSRFWIELPKG